MFSNVGLGFQDNLMAMATVTSLSLPPSLSSLRTILSDTEVSELSSQYVLLQVIIDEQRRICNFGVDATTYFCQCGQKGKGEKEVIICVRRVVRLIGQEIQM